MLLKDARLETYYKNKKLVCIADVELDDERKIVVNIYYKTPWLLETSTEISK